MELSDRQEQVKRRFINERGQWGPIWQDFLELDAEFLEVYLDFFMVPWRKAALNAKSRELIYVGLDASATHLYEPGLRLHIRAAIQQGASASEIVEVIQLASTLGIHSVTVAMPILVEVLDARGLRGPQSSLSRYQLELKDRFVQKRGYWREFWNDTLELDPELFDAYTRLSSLPVERGLLEPKIRELICLAFNASTTHLHAPSIRLHIEGALDNGSTLEEILEAIEIASVIGLHAATFAIPILAQELGVREQDKS